MKNFVLTLILLSSAAAVAAPYHQMYISNRTEQNQGAGTPNSCVLGVSDYDGRFAIEWRVYDHNPLWMQESPNSGYRLVASNGTNCAKTICFTHGDRDAKTFKDTAKASQYVDQDGQIQSFKPFIPYYFAARQFIDDNANGIWDQGEFVRDWTPAIQVYNSADYVNRCTFNEFYNK